MTRRFALLLILGVVPIALVAAACGTDDGADVRSSTAGSASGNSGSPSNPDSASGSASGTGLSLEDTQTAGSGNALVAQGVLAYGDYVADQVDDTIAKTKVLTHAVRAGNLQAARAAYPPSREGWEPHRADRRLVERSTAPDSRVDIRGTDADLHRLKG
jgi:iron uptake system component EfeO